MPTSSRRAVSRKLAEALRPLVTDPARPAEMGARMQALARPQAAATIIDWCQAQARQFLLEYHMVTPERRRTVSTFEIATLYNTA